MIFSGYGVTTSHVCEYEDDHKNKFIARIQMEKSFIYNLKNIFRK
jgi:hypothetical protein